MKELTYKIKDFEGPLDLLLHLIAKHKMQLFDIRITELIDQYLDFIGDVGPDELEPTSEFVEMAARLVYMKSVAMLPRNEEEKEELVRELTGKLIEYHLCKEAASRLRDRTLGINFFVRTPAQVKLPTEYSCLHPASDLRDAYIMSRGRTKPQPQGTEFEPLVSAPVVSVESRVIHIMSTLKKFGGRHISRFFVGSGSRSETVATFLGILELIRDGKIGVDDDGNVTERKERNA